MTNVNIAESCLLETEYYRYQRKDGKPGRLMERYYWFTPLNKCQLCDKLSTPKKVHFRNDCYDSDSGTPMLCTGCWNKIRPIFAFHRELQQLKTLSRKLKRTNHERS